MQNNAIKMAAETDAWRLRWFRGHETPGISRTLGKTSGFWRTCSRLEPFQKHDGLGNPGWCLTARRCTYIHTHTGLKEAGPAFQQWSLLSTGIMMIFIFFFIWLEWVSEVTQLCPTLCDPMDYSIPCSSIHGILQARVLEWAAISSSRGSSWPRDQTRVSRIVDRCFTIWATREVLSKYKTFNYILSKIFLKSFFLIIDL